MLRFFSVGVIVCVLISPLILHGEEDLIPSPKPSTNLFAGFGPAFNITGGTLGFAQVGADFLIAATNNFRFLLGPQANVFFAPGTNLNFGFIGLNLKLSHEKILENNRRIDIYGRVPIQIGVGRSHGSNALGLNLALNPGLAFYFNNILGIYAELGGQIMTHVLSLDSSPLVYLLMSVNMGLAFNL